LIREALFLAQVGKIRSITYFEKRISSIYIAQGGQEKYYIFLICSQEKYLCCQEKVQEASGNNIRQDANEPLSASIFGIKTMPVS